MKGYEVAQGRGIEYMDIVRPEKGVRGGQLCGP